MLLLFVIGLCISGISLGQLDVNVGGQQDIDFSPTLLNNYYSGMWNIRPEMNVGSLTTGIQKNMEVSPMWLQSPELIAEAVYHPVQRNIEMSAYLKKDLPSTFISAKHQGGRGQNYDIPLYIESLKEIELAVLHLKENLLSMSGAIPYLIDPRRDFAEIISVIQGIAKEIADSCIIINYEKSYQRFIDKFSPNGIKKPQMIINEIQQDLAKFQNLVMPLQKLIKEVCPDGSTTKYCNFVIHEIVLKHPEKYQKVSTLFFAGFRTAYELNNKMKEFGAVSTCHAAHKMIIESPAVIKPIVYALSHLMRLLPSPFRNSCQSNV